MLDPQIHSRNQQRYFRSSLVDFMGDTPLVQLPKVITNADADVFVKLEEYNPGGSIK